jgi:hypothetical protein
VEVCGANPSNTIFYLALPTRTALKGGGAQTPLRIKDEILKKYGLPLVRFRTDGSNERGRLLEAVLAGETGLNGQDSSSAIDNR